MKPPDGEAEAMTELALPNDRLAYLRLALTEIIGLAQSDHLPAIIAKAREALATLAVDPPSALPTEEDPVGPGGRSGRSTEAVDELRRIKEYASREHPLLSARACPLCVWKPGGIFVSPCTYHAELRRLRGMLSFEQFVGLAAAP